MTKTNIDPQEIAKFDKIASDWWNPEGKMKPLHQLNPLRLSYVEKHTDLNNKSVPLIQLIFLNRS